MDSLEAYRISNAPPSMYYIADFTSAEEEASILNKIPPNRWVTLSNRRLQSIPTQLTANNTLLASRLPDWLTKPVVERLDELKVFENAPHGINHCLVNEYLPGQGIMPHEDGGAYHPVVATVSLGGTIVLDVTTKPTVETSEGKLERPASYRIVQEARSLLVTTGSAYVDTLHGIAEVEIDHDLTSLTGANWSLLAHPETILANKSCNQRKPRISLTLRDVKKVSSAGRKIFGKPKT